MKEFDVSKIRIITKDNIEDDTYIIRDSELTGSDEEIQALKERLGLVPKRDNAD